MNAKQNEYVIIAGCGRLGGHLANQFSRAGHSVVAIDVNEAKFQNLSTEFSGFRLEGDASELDILKRAKTHEAQKVIAVTRHDNMNLTIAQIAKEVFHVPTVVARVSDPQREMIYRDLGIHTVCPVLLASAELVHRFTQASSEESAK